MASTLIRTPGKKRKRSGKELPPGDGDQGASGRNNSESDSSSSTSESLNPNPRPGKTANVNAAPIEKLPLEILQEIAILSGNGSIINTNRYFRSTLSNDHVYLGLLVQVFTLDEEGNDENMSDEESKLLSWNWLTWELWQRFLKKWLQNRTKFGLLNGKRLLREHVPDGFSLSEFYDRFPLPHVNGQDVIYHSPASSVLGAESEPIEQSDSDVDADFDFVGSQHVEINTENEAAAGNPPGEDDDSIEQSHDDIASDIESEAAEVAGPVSAAHPFQPIFVPVPWVSCHNIPATGPAYVKATDGFVSKGTRLPARLLVGPWTDDKICFLKDLVRRRGTLNWKRSTSGEAAASGLKDAIQNGKLEAVEVLLRQEVGVVVDVETICLAISVPKEFATRFDIFDRVLFSTTQIYDDEHNHEWDADACFIHNPHDLDPTLLARRGREREIDWTDRRIWEAALAADEGFSKFCIRRLYQVQFIADGDAGWRTGREGVQRNLDVWPESGP